jgi:hypothetical protein
MRSRVFPLAIISLFTPICFVALQAPHSTKAALAPASQQQDRVRKEVPEACPVTKPPAQPFVPPPPHWTDHGPDGFWYGTESLWTLLGVQGTWNIRNNVNVLEGKRGYSTKLIYWRRGFDWRREPEPGLIVIAKRLDREAPPVAAGPAHAVFVTTERPGMMTGIDIPSTGCWELTAQYGAQRLSFVVSVQP